MTWTALPAGAAIALLPGTAYAIVASLKASHSAADVAALAAGRGLTLRDYAEEGQRPGLGPDPRGPAYRYIAAIAVAGAGGQLPWAVPFPASLFDGSQLVEAWSAPASALPPAGKAIAAPAPPPAVDGPDELSGPWPWIVGASFAGAAGWHWWRRRGRGRRA